ncbi:MAG: class I tRNA ligase family protein, partial [Muribaculaceae bacterium]|nr:class I tRNA ligase family protein [Muribaculaceae bacterium]
YKTTYRISLDNIQYWCISRQLWWGHRIPAYYYTDKDGVQQIAVAESAEDALEVARKQSDMPGLSADDLTQDPDALDTWFSSWLWPISLFNGILDPGNEEIRYYYPTATLVTGPDIIFFWVARMIMAGYEYVGDKPFDNVYFTGIVRDSIGRKMSKMLGNSPDALELIAKYGADGVRMGLMLAAPAGNDIMYDDKLVEQGRNFCNKIWNAFRLVKGWEVDPSIPTPESSRQAVRWFESKLNQALAEVDDLFGKFRLNEALMVIYRLFWDEFSSWYLEMIKPAYQKPIDKATYEATLVFFDSLLRLLHPFMPFITEELWQHLATRGQAESIMYASLPLPGEIDPALIADMEIAKDIVAGV